MGIDWDNGIKFICSVDWDDIVNLHNIRNGLEEGGIVEIQIDDEPCVLISKDSILCNKTLLEYVFKHDDILFIKKKETVD